MKGKPLPFLLLAPFFAALFIFWMIPFIRGFEMSLQSNELVGPTTFVGFQNYQDLLSDTRFRHAILNTLTYCTLTLALVLPTSLALAYGLLRLPLWLRGPLQFTLILPGLTPPMVLALLYLLVFNGSQGLLNQLILAPIGIPHVDWIRDPRFIKPSLALLALWRWTGFTSLIFMSGLAGIPSTLADTARTEGATSWQIFRWVTWPLLRPVTAFVLAFLLLDTFVLFEGAYVLLSSSGGTLDAGLLLVSYAYLTAFSLGNFGLAAAISFAASPILMLGLWFLLRQGRIHQNKSVTGIV